MTFSTAKMQEWRSMQQRKPRDSNLHPRGHTIRGRPKLATTIRGSKQSCPLLVGQRDQVHEAPVPALELPAARDPVPRVVLAHLLVPGRPAPAQRPPAQDLPVSPVQDHQEVLGALVAVK